MWNDGCDCRGAQRNRIFHHANAGIPDRSLPVPCNLDLYRIQQLSNIALPVYLLSYQLEPDFSGTFYLFYDCLSKASEKRNLKHMFVCGIKYMY